MHLKNRILVTTKYTKIVTRNYIYILLEFICVTQFHMCCIDGGKVTVKFAAHSFCVMRYRNESNLA